MGSEQFQIFRMVTDIILELSNQGNDWFNLGACLFLISCKKEFKLLSICETISLGPWDICMCTS